MALTPDDVVTKQFQHVRFKEGFDPDEVDDFLDEIVVEWRKTIAENEQLKAKVAEFESGDAAAAPAAESAPVAVEAEPAADETESAPAAAPATAAAGGGAAATAGIIELAQRLHDEHVAEGVAQRDQLIADAKAQAASIIDDAETRGREAREKLERDRTELEGRITELRSFERDYRAQLRGYIEGKLRDLETTATSSGATPVSAVGL
ncbi:DivIVA domain-containing protein [Microbacterium marmarense]|uniref:Cell wall synthesis protein Wag31 n=1 Tax=Microbacterium marmarense TaxID=3122051 RepID=A0ABU8LTR3_9MICO